MGLRIEHLLTVTNTQRSLVLQVQQKLWELLSVRGSNIKCTAMQSMMAATTSCSVFDPWVRKERRKRRQFERSGERGGSSNRMASTGSACSAGKTWIQAGYLCSFSALLNHGQIQQCASQCSFSSTRCHQTSSRFCKDRCSSYGDVADTSTSCTSGVGLAHCPSLSSGMATVHRHQSDGQLERNT